MTDPWFKFYSSDWIGGTACLSPSERGIYITLLAMIYEAHGPIERNDRRLSRVCGCTPIAFRKALNVLIEEGKIIEADGTLFNERAKKIISERHFRVQKASLAASARWSEKTEKSEQNQQNDDAQAMHKQCASNAKPEARSQIPDIDDDDSAGARRDDPTFRERLLVAAGHDASGVTANGRIVGSRAEMEAFEKARNDLAISEADALAIVGEVTTRRQGQPPPSSLKYFINSMRDFAGARDAPPITPSDQPAKPAKSNWRASEAEREQARKLDFYKRVANQK